MMNLNRIKKSTPDRLHHLLLLLSTLLLLISFRPVLASGGDDPLLAMVMLDQLEVRDTEGDNPLLLEGQAWLGKDLHKLWFKTELERVDNKTEQVELQALYSRAVSAYWDLQAGVRHDFKPTPERSWAVVGVQGLAPYFFEVDAALFVGESGRTALRLEAEYELMFTQRLVLSPELEMNFYGQNDADTGVGSGLSDVELGLRLRYEIRREFAPYIGVNWSRKYGNSADFARAEGEDIDDAQFVMGIRAWF